MSFQTDPKILTITVNVYHFNEQTKASPALTLHVSTLLFIYF